MFKWEVNTKIYTVIMGIIKSINCNAQCKSGEPPEDGEMKEMTVSFRQRIRNSNPGGQGRARYPSVTEAPHNIECERRRNFLKPECQSRGNEMNRALGHLCPHIG